VAALAGGLAAAAAVAVAVMTIRARPPSPATPTAGGDRPGVSRGELAPVAGGTLRLPGSTPSTLDPALVRDVSAAEYIYEIFSGLVTLSPDMQIVPDLATSWSVDDAGRVYTFALREGATFHDGRAVTADDVVFSLERACDPSLASDVAATYLGDIVGCLDKLAGRVASVAGVSAPDSRTVTIRVDAPKAYFLSKLTYPTSFVVDRAETGDADWHRTPNGTGPFRLRAFEPDEELVLVRNEAYFGEVPLLDEVHFDLRPVMAPTLYENDELDATPVGIEGLSAARDPLNPLSHELVVGAGSLSITYVAFNAAKPPFDDRHVRRAFNFALDQRWLTEVVLEGAVTPAQWILPPAMPGHTPDVSPFTFDPERARSELRQSRYGGADRLPPVTLVTSGDGSVSPGVAATVDALSSTLGVEITIEQAPWELFQAEMADGRYDMWVLGWSADYPDPQDFLDLLFHSGSPLNQTGYANAEIDTLLEEARVEPDPTTRMALYATIERRVMEDAPWLPLFSGEDAWLVKPYVRGFIVPPVVVPRLGRVWLVER
jgi:ABC-type transport system substrate-binding protein